MDFDWGFLKLFSLTVFLKLISVVYNFNYVCSTDMVLSRSFGLCCLKVISELTLSCIYQKGRINGKMK